MLSNSNKRHSKATVRLDNRDGLEVPAHGNAAPDMAVEPIRDREAVGVALHGLQASSIGPATCLDQLIKIDHAITAEADAVPHLKTEIPR